MTKDCCSLTRTGKHRTRDWEGARGRLPRRGTEGRVPKDRTLASSHIGAKESYSGRLVLEKTVDGMDNV